MGMKKGDNPFPIGSTDDCVFTDPWMVEFYATSWESLILHGILCCLLGKRHQEKVDMDSLQYVIKTFGTSD